MSKLSEILFGSSTRQPPRFQNTRLQHAQGRRRTIGEVRSIEERFVINPDQEFLKVWDNTDTLRVHVGKLSDTPTYGLAVYDASGNTLLGFATGNVLYFADDEIYFMAGGLEPTDVAGDYVSVYNGNQLRFNTLAGGLAGYLGYDSVTPSVTLDVTGASGEMRIQGANVQLGESGGSMGFYGNNGTTKQTITGSRAGNAALASLLTAMANLNLITDSSSA